MVTEQLIYRRGRTPRVLYQAESDLPGGDPVLNLEEIETLACAIRAVHRHFRPILDPEGENRWFAMDMEFKLIGEDRELLIKQARPYSFGDAEFSADCREF